MRLNREPRHHDELRLTILFNVGTMTSDKFASMRWSAAGHYRNKMIRQYTAEDAIGNGADFRKDASLPTGSYGSHDSIRREAASALPRNALFRRTFGFRWIIAVS